MLCFITASLKFRFVNETFEIYPVCMNYEEISPVNGCRLNVRYDTLHQKMFDNRLHTENAQTQRSYVLFIHIGVA